VADARNGRTHDAEEADEHCIGYSDDCATRFSASPGTASRIDMLMREA
jgi:hypothetical protein